MATAHESYAARYQAPGRAVSSSSRSHTRAVRRLIAEAVREAEALPLDAMRKLAPVLARAQAELERGLLQWLKDAPEAAHRFTAHHMRTMLRQLRAVADTIAELEPALADALASGNAQAAGLSNRALSRDIGRMAQVFDGGVVGLTHLNLPVASRLIERNNWLLSRYKRQAAAYGNRAFREIRNRLSLGVLKGETWGQTAHRIVRLTPAGQANPGAVRAVRQWMRSPVGTPPPTSLAADMAGGLWRGPYAQAERLVRSESVNAYNAHHQRGIEEFANQQEGVMKRWDASPDRRCAICHALDGQTVPVDEPFSNGLMYPPAHPNGRCISIPWMKHWPELQPLPAIDTPTQRRRAPPARPVVTRGGTAIETRRALGHRDTTLGKGPSTRR